MLELMGLWALGLWGYGNKLTARVPNYSPLIHKLTAVFTKRSKKEFGIWVAIVCPGSGLGYSRIYLPILRLRVRLMGERLCGPDTDVLRCLMHSNPKYFVTGSGNVDSLYETNTDAVPINNSFNDHKMIHKE